MKVFVTPSRDEIGKFRAIVQAFPEIWISSILDVGSRSRKLKGALPNREVRYCGLDLHPPSADVIGDVARLPFGNKSFNTVVGLDVLEHTDDIYKAFHELCRVARKYVSICLPNAYEVKCRLKFLLGLRLSGKYGLPLNPPDDRHRWLFSLREAKTFIHTMGRRHGFEVIAEGSLIGPRRGFALGRFMVSQFPNLLSPWYVALLHRRKSEPSCGG